MHLLAAQPGGFVDDEGIIDLDQSPADIVLLAAADSRLAAFADSYDAWFCHASQQGVTIPSLRLANWMQLVKPAAYDLYEHKVLEQAKIVVVSLLGGRNYWEYGFERLVAWQAAKAGRQLLLMPGDDTADPELFDASHFNGGGPRAAEKLWRYSREGGRANCLQALRFLANQGLAYDGALFQWREPQALPPCLIYWPQQGQVSVNEWRAQQADTAPVCLLLFYRSHLQSANTPMFDELIAILQAQGMAPLPVAVASLKNPESLGLCRRLLAQCPASVVINTTSFSSHRAPSPDLSSTPTAFESPFGDLPVLQLVLSSATEADWQNHSQGLRSRDIAMQVVLPEMDGRIITRAVSFKTESHISELCEISVVRYALHHERARFVATLALAYCQLKSKPNSDKRLALILANYPTKDGRIGNGVGLDTPNSTLNMLTALRAAGYPLGDEALPDDGDALIQWLLETVTNNPNTLHSRGCWQSIAVDDYWRYFSQLPQPNQEAVLARWGGPEQDPKYRNGRLMLAGMRLGDTFIGIQPARGFNVDLNANYHDPDLVPPHAYLAFYFWLRHCYQVDAIVHVGKHGNLEWLPGKGGALSDQCWPDIALGPTPHFYPFIVNDPGEGAQAKRRSQAVIIDHLMPPMTRAETYGDLAALEGLVDEYYQALGLDARREAWLKQEILQLVRESDVWQELFPHSAPTAKAPDTVTDDELLETLDAYLCDIKEAQIRHGLHILGQLPDDAKLADTVVALLRLPRGDSHTDPACGGILHNLAADFGMLGDDIGFDPMSADTTPWNGPKPPRLQQVSESLWRTAADTRERLELLAIQWVQHYVLAQADIAELYRQAPKTAALLQYAKQTLKPALDASVDNEIANVLRGLGGAFVEPGPSGAPTRGRLDCLPTGRNFFSVDNRSIPSPAAWAIGEKSAQALIERHLQEQGDFPRQLGLSVWGTATMRTGGDDIAQAFALMGVKPIWAQGSHRVVDFEVIPTMLLQRPRVDVTLRVSGFFRDAFPNVMKLFDAAVQAIATLEEPGGNTLQAGIEQRQQVLMAQGMPEAEAWRQASYRVFGSKPGAYGAGLQGLIDERCWETAADLAEAYVNWGGYAYGDHRLASDGQQTLDDAYNTADGIEAKGAFTERLAKIDVVVQNQDNREHDLLDSDDYYQFQGGMTNAVTVFGDAADQRTPTVYHNDHSNPSAPKVRTLKEELNRVIRSRVLNPKWINAMREHGYKGAFEMSASVDYLFAYDATTGLIDGYQYEQVSEALVFDDDNRAFLEQSNPHALEAMAERLLEASQRGLWQDSADYADKLRDLLLALGDEREQTGH